MTVSDAGFDATKPEVDFDDSGKALLIWQRFDGPICGCRPRPGRPVSVECSRTRPRSRTPDRTGSTSKADAGPDVDANGVTVWTRSDGTKLRVQSSRRRDVAGFPRAKGATPTRVALVPGYTQCAAPNRTHGPALAFPSCNPPVRNSARADRRHPRREQVRRELRPASRSSEVLIGNPATEADEADVALTVSITDVRNHPSGSDYTGRVGVTHESPDHRQRERQRAARAGHRPDHAAAVLRTVRRHRGHHHRRHLLARDDLDALLPGAVQERQRAIWELGQIQVRDAGPNGTGYAACPPTCGDGDETVFMRQGIFVP